MPGSGEHAAEVEILNSQSPDFFMKIVWIMYNVASVACILVTIVFWSLIFPYIKLDDVGGDEVLINVQLHGITSVIVVIEHCVSAIPIRLPHVVFTLIYGMLYVIFAGCFYAADHRHVMYPNILDFSNPKNTAIVCVVTAFVGLPLIQLFLFALYKFRTWLFDKLCPEEL